MSSRRPVLQRERKKMNNRSALAEEPSREPSVFLFHGTDLPTAERLAENELDDEHELIYPARFSSKRHIYVEPVGEQQRADIFAHVGWITFVHGLKKCAIAGLYEGCESGDVGLVRWECSRRCVDKLLKLDEREFMSNFYDIYRVKSSALRHAVSQGLARPKLFPIRGCYAAGWRAAYLLAFHRSGIWLNSENLKLAAKFEETYARPGWGDIERRLIKPAWLESGCDSDEFTRSLMASELD